MRVILLTFIATVVCSCSPVEPVSRELPTKYTNSATMGAAADAAQSNFTTESFK